MCKYASLIFCQEFSKEKFVRKCFFVERVRVRYWSLGAEKSAIVGYAIGLMVAYAFAVQYPEDRARGVTDCVTRLIW
jgi:pimeloyl-ACP methyl ester carboxylesterase